MASTPKSLSNNLRWRFGLLSFIACVVLAVFTLQTGVAYVGPDGLYCSGRDNRDGTCAAAWKEAVVRSTVLVGGHTDEAKVTSANDLRTARLAFVVALALLIVSVVAPCLRSKHRRPGASANGSRGETGG
ncbi:MAG TPA: hypothetical protein VGM94_19290 [Galbitalea sp.]|jgi:hypothetical protein